MFVPPQQAIDMEHGGGTSTQPTNQPITLPMKQSTTEPMTQTTVLPTTQSTIKPMTQSPTQPMIQPTTQSTIQPMTQRPTQPMIQPVVQPTAQPIIEEQVTQPMTQPMTQPTTQPITQPMIEPMTQPMKQPMLQPMIEPMTQPTTQPMKQPMTQPMIDPMTQPTTQPMKQPMSQPVIEPMTQPTPQPMKQPMAQPMTQPMKQPMTQPMNEPTTQPIIQPVTQWITQQTIQPMAQPVTQQTIQPMTEPKIQPTSQPTTQPVFSASNEPVMGGLISIDSISSSSSSFDGSFDLPVDLSNAKDDDPKAPISKLDQKSHTSPKPVEPLVDPIQHNSSPKPGEPLVDIIQFNSPRKPMEPLVDPTQPNDWNPYGSSAVKQSPPVQTMSRPNNIPGYDPNRIPSSIFATKPASQADWSVASNESLFSIHMGNNSFSRDHAILLGKSEEFFKFDDLINTVPGQLPKSSETNNSPYALPTLMESTSDLENFRHSLSIEDDLITTKKGIVDLTPKASMKMTKDINKETVFAHNSSNISDGRETPTRDGTRTSASSSSSFAFPVLMGDGVSNAPVKSPRAKVQEKTVESPIEKPKKESQPQPKTPTPKTAVKTKWFSWFHTWSFPRASFCCRR